MLVLKGVPLPYYVIFCHGVGNGAIGMVAGVSIVYYKSRSAENALMIFCENYSLQFSF